jgi:hypothetical protein
MITKEDIKQLIREAITEMNTEDFSDDTRRFLKMFPHKIAIPPSQVTTPLLPKTKPISKAVQPKIKAVKPWIPKGYTLTDKEMEALKKMTEKQRLVFYIKKRRAVRIANGLCGECGAPAEKNKDGTPKTYCTKHLKQRRALVQGLIDKGICLRCRKKPGVLTASGKRLRLCATCAKEQSEEVKLRRLEYLRKNICTICHKNPLYTTPEGKKLTICKKCSDIVKKQHVIYRKRAKLKQK